MKLSHQEPEKILFITRKFPPSVGGMETAAYELHNALRDGTGQIELIAWGGSNKWLPVVYFWLFGRALVSVLARRPDVILLQDGVMAPLGWALKVLSGLPTLIVIHGREVTYTNTVYRSLVLPFIKRQTAFAAVSEGTRCAIDAIGVESKRVEVIRNGLHDVFYSSKPRVEQLLIVAQEADLPFPRLEHSRVLVTTGRLVKRKGVSWFVDNVMPKIVTDDPGILYLVAGAGPQRTEIELAIRRNNLTDNVKLLGRVTHECLKALYNVADVFVMPNVHVPNDIEGFGLVAIEAASCGATIVASDLDGIGDAVVDGMNGYLVPAGDAAAYTYVIARELAQRSQSPAAVRRYTLEHYSWTETAKTYRSLARSIAADGAVLTESSSENIPEADLPDLASDLHC